MAHDVFISHSTKDKTISDAICAALEGAGIRCWIAPRDVQPGRPFAGEINRAIQQSKVMVLVFSAHSNNSEQVLREVQLAVTGHLHIVQFRLEDVPLNDDLGYFLSTPHWLDAIEPPLENHIKRLKTSVKALVVPPSDQSVTAGASDSSFPAQKREVPAEVAERHDSPAGKGLHVAANSGRKFLFAGVIVALLMASVLSAWWFGLEQPRQNAAKIRKDSLKAAETASKEQPYVNSLGMKFVPVPRTHILFSVWETRVKEYKVFADATKREWPNPGFTQTDEHPAVNVTWVDATMFCEWLTEFEREAGLLAPSQEYRLPTDLEWSAAVGLEKESGNTPQERDMKKKGIYPWGTKWPPHTGAGNYDPTLNVDDYENTSPVGSFASNRYGIHDLGGNVWEWCQDWYDANENNRVLRGASWRFNVNPDGLLSSCRGKTPVLRDAIYGIRCVLVAESSR